MAQGFRFLLSNTIVSMFFLLFVLYALACALLYLFQSRLVYFPDQKIYATPHEIGLSYDELSLVTADGVRLSAWHIPSEENRATLLYCHGNAGNISHRLEHLKILHDLGVNTLIFDYRGFGASEGTPTEEGTYLDVEAAWAHLVERMGVPEERIVLLGKSLGGPIAAWLAARKPVGGLILHSTFTSVPELARSLYPIFPVKLLARYHYNTRESLVNVNAPLLVVHSVQDEIVPFSMGQRLYEQGAGPKVFLALEGGHNTALWVSRDAYADGLNNFISQYVVGSSSD